jgi:hypothetical protein
MIDPNSEVTSALRHLGTLVAGILIRQGWVEASYTETVIGLVIASGIIVLAWINKQAAKRTKADTVAVALTLPANTRPDTLNSALVEENLPTVDLK